MKILLKSFHLNSHTTLWFHLQTYFIKHNYPHEDTQYEKIFIYTPQKSPVLKCGSKSESGLFFYLFRKHFSMASFSPLSSSVSSCFKKKWCVMATRRYFVASVI